MTSNNFNKIFCIECQQEVMARLTNGSEVYSHRKDLYNLPFWICDECQNFVGCHHQTKDPTRPLGCIPNREMKNFRRLIHSLLDPLWKNKLMKRKDIYRILSEALGRPYHTAELRTIEEARKIYRILLKLKKDNSSNISNY